MRYVLLAAGATLIGIAPAMAAPIELSGRAEARAGYGSNPFLRPGADRSAAVLGFTLSPVLKRTFATGTTTLTGTYSREEYLRNYGSPDTAQIRLQQVQDLNPRLSMNASIAYVSSTNALVNNPASGPAAGDVPVDIGSDVDPLTIGARTRRYQGALAFAYRPSLVDTITLTGGYAHSLSNRSSGITRYDFYNASVGYSRAFGERLQLGGRMGYSRTESGLFPTVSSYEPSVVVTYRFSEIWVFTGNIGAAVRRAPSIGLNSTGLGFNLSLCGTYPLTSVCVIGNRVTSASGFGGARVNSNLAVRVTQQLTAVDSATLAVSYVDSKSIGGINFSGQQYTQANASFDHKIGARWLVGADGRYQTRAQDFRSNARAFTISAHIGYLFGRATS